MILISFVKYLNCNVFTTVDQTCGMHLFHQTKAFTMGNEILTYCAIRFFSELLLLFIFYVLCLNIVCMYLLGFYLFIFGLFSSSQNGKK